MIRAGSSEVTRPIVPATPPTGISEAQRIDFFAACAGKITWQVYFQKSRRRGLTL